MNKSELDKYKLHFEHLDYDPIMVLLSSLRIVYHKRLKLFKSIVRKKTIV